MAVIRAASSRRVRSVSARRADSSRERPSSRTSSALRIAIAAWLARAASWASSASPKASVRRDAMEIVPRAVPSASSGTATTERIPVSRAIACAASG